MGAVEAGVLCVDERVYWYDDEIEREYSNNNDNSKVEQK